MTNNLPPFSSRIAGERRRVTVLFADLAGFTALAERLDPEEALVLVNTCFDALTPVIERYGGAVDKFIGDEIMALFGAPAAHEDDVERALRAALDMRQALAVLNAWQGTELGLHVGINSGLAVAGGIGSRGRQSYSVIGDPVNVAARISHASQPGEILVGAETYRQAAQVFEFEALEALHLKGKAEPVPVYRLLGLRSRPAAQRGLPGLHSPLVGRETEMKNLLRLGERLRQGQGGVALILGEAGAGKSRLISEWRNVMESAAPEAGAFRWSGAHCLSYGRDTAYQAVVGLLHALLGGGEQAAQALGSLLAECCTQAAEQSGPYLAHLLSLEETAQAGWGSPPNLQALEPQVLKARYAQAVQELLRGLSELAPLVLVLEDFHWADLSSVELLQRLLPLIEQTPVLLCFVARPEPESPSWRLVEALTPYLAGERGAHLHLYSLPDLESRRLIANLLNLPDLTDQALPGALYRLVLSKSDGNPFFIEEFIRMLFDSGVLAASEQGWVIRQGFESLQIPDSLQGLLMGRVDRLLEPLRVVLRLAAVIGRRFELPLLQAVLEEEDWQWLGGLPSALQELEQNGLIRPAPAEAGAPVYIFQHTLLQEAAYQALLNQDRRRLHRLVGDALEHSLGQQTEGSAAQLALHFEQAGDERRALHYYHLAGENAYRQYGLTEAVQHFRRALALASRLENACPPEMLRALALHCGRCLELSALYQEALALYQELETQANALAAPALALAMIIEQAKLYATPNPLRNHDLGLAISERGLALAKSLGDEPAEARLEWIMILLGWLSGDWDFARAHAERSLSIARRLNLPEQLAYSLHDAHRVYKKEAALACLMESQQLWRELGNQAMLADNLCSTADVYARRQDFAAALPLAREGYQVSRSIDNLWNQAYASALIGELEHEQGHISQAITALQEALQVSAQAGVFILFNRVLHTLWQLYAVDLGALDQAEDLLSQAERLLGPQLDVPAPFFNATHRFLLESYRCRIALRRPGDPAQQASQAKASYESLWQEMEVRYGAETLTSQALSRMRWVQLELLEANGDYAPALPLAESVLVELTTLGYRRVLMDTRGLFARLLARLGRVTEARQEMSAVLSLVKPEIETMTYLRGLVSLIVIENLSGDQQAVQRWQQAAAPLVLAVAQQIDDPALRQIYLTHALEWALLPAQGMPNP